MKTLLNPQNPIQKKILPLLINIFPNVQFFITMHSPFILMSVDNAAIYDLEKKIIVEDGLGKLPYAGVVEGYFGTDTLSGELRRRFNSYKELSKKEMLDDNDYREIAELEYYLDEIPDYLSLDISAEYHRIKLEMEGRSYDKDR